MNNEPCKVCGNTDMNLIDGFYYCVECGTQDTNIMETLVEDVALQDGTFAIKQKARVKKIARVVANVSPEWYKWQSCNYILSGMVKELMDLGAGPKFKMRVMWLWTLYIKKFQNKQELGLPADADEVDESSIPYNLVTACRKPIKNSIKSVRLHVDIRKVTVNLLITILYLALNFDRSEILVSDLVRFIREGRLSYKNSLKYVPEEIDVTKFDLKKSIMPMKMANVEYINVQAMSFLKIMNLGCPIVPNLRKIVERYVKELCLPDCFKDLVFSLMNLVPCDYLEIDIFIMKTINAVPFYGARVMAYILVALKMCFGLDDEYETKLSDAVDSVNKENCHMKCHKLGVFSTSSDRLFCFREWVQFLLLRKLVLSKSYVPLSLLYRMDVDDYVYMEQSDVKSPYKEQPSVTDDITMSLLEKIKTDTVKEVIPKKAFFPSLTPFTDYTDVVLKNCHDPEIRLILSEDFTQYSLKYAYESLDLRVSDDSENIIVGINETNKCIKSEIKSKVSSSYHIHRDDSLVFVRNCENKNWMKTKRPSQKHVRKVKENDRHDDDSDSHDEYLYDSETSMNDAVDEDECSYKKQDFIEVDKTGNIFDDDFQNLAEYEPKDNHELLDIKEEPIDEEHLEFNSYNRESMDAENNVLKHDADNLNDVQPSDTDEDVLQFYNPETFDREGTIKHLVLLACQKHKIAIPKEYTTIGNKEPRKRKIQNINKENNNDDAVCEKKAKVRTKPGEIRKDVNILLSAYYDSLKHDVFSSVSHHIRDLVENFERTREDFEAEDQADGDFHNDLEIFRNESNQNKNGENINSADNTSNVEDPSILEIENQTHDDREVAETEDAYKGDPKFDEKIYDVKQLYLTKCDENFEDIFDIRDDPDVDRIISQKIEEESVTMNRKSTKHDNKNEEGFSEWEDEVPLSEIKELMLERKNVHEDAFEKLGYLVKNRKNITKNNYWVRQEKILSRVHQRVDSFTNEMKETYPKSFSVLIVECAAMLDCTPFILYKYMVQIEERLIHK
ncbi:uncharacterized protein TAF1B [Plodia interpunctella]|uniref:uncharacterized protein TAF1B n=1 Tax=Plodia interpunctella TaxID=58824 RepID=UPI002367E0A9|nr:uncharacterized protein LOC128680616 [Plodia interpunctella]